MIFMCDKDMRATTDNHPHIKESLANLKLKYPQVDASYFKDRTIYQALLFCEQNQESFIHDHDAFDFIRWHEFSCDVLPGGGSKAIGVDKIIKACGLNKEDRKSTRLNSSHVASSYAVFCLKKTII